MKCVCWFLFIYQVIEKAKEGESLEELRARTAIQFSEEANSITRPSKKQKKNVLDDAVTKFGKITGWDVHHCSLLSWDVTSTRLYKYLRFIFDSEDGFEGSV